MRGVLAGRGAREVLRRPGAGSVVASFEEACYIEVEGSRVALVSPTVHAGPLHLVLDARPPRPHPGGSVRVGLDELVVDGTPIDVASAADWLGELPPPPVVRRHATSISSVAERGSLRSALRAEPFEEIAARARALLERGRLGEAAVLLGGLGPGLTPSGDDALVGIAFGLRAALGRAFEPGARRALGGAGLGPFGRGPVEFAARGQVLAPVHELVSAVVRGEAARAAEAARAIAAVGETSGSDMLLGLAWALGGNAVYAVAASEGLGVRPSASAR